MWPNRRLIDLFKIQHPLLLAPMAGFSTVSLAAAVCDAGGLGSVACAMMQPRTVAETIREFRGLTDKPLNVNFFCHLPANADEENEKSWHHRLLPYYLELGIDHQPRPSRSDIAPFGELMCQVIESCRPEVVSFHFGLPDQALVGRVKAAGCRVISSATTVEEARWLEARGVDAIIAQGYEAGGHRATFLTGRFSDTIASQPGTMALVPQIVDAVRVPVVAAGGIADGRGVAAAFALGAAAVQIGTAYLLCPEAATPSLHRYALRQAREDATVLTNVFSGRTARALTNRLVLEVGPIADSVPDFPLPVGELIGLRAEAESRGCSDFSPLWSGQSAALSKEIPAKALTFGLTRGAIERFKQLNGCSPS